MKLPISDRLLACAAFVPRGSRVADIGCDTQLLKEAQEAAEKLLAEDPELARHPATAERVAELFTQNADTLN